MYLVNFLQQDILFLRVHCEHVTDKDQETASGFRPGHQDNRALVSNLLEEKALVMDNATGLKTDKMYICWCQFWSARLTLTVPVRTIDAL